MTRILLSELFGYNRWSAICILLNMICNMLLATSTMVSYLMTGRFSETAVVGLLVSFTSGFSVIVIHLLSIMAREQRNCDGLIEMQPNNLIIDRSTGSKSCKDLCTKIVIKFCKYVYQHIFNKKTEKERES